TISTITSHAKCNVLKYKIIVVNENSTVRGTGECYLEIKCKVLRELFVHDLSRDNTILAIANGLEDNNDNFHLYTNYKTYKSSLKAIVEFSHHIQPLFLLPALENLESGLDYKINFRPGKGDKIEDLHERVAKRILNVCLTNGGLYIKLGQAIGVQSAILPAAFQRTFKQLFDDAPAVDFDRVVKLFKEDFNCHPDEMFDDSERTAIASASIAQVHRAKLKNGTPVAVKIQKPDIRRQM
ncbi:15849_t:CDS:2, partial [Dentiscutata heterogama]